MSSSTSQSGFLFFFQAEDGIRDGHVTGVQTCALPISLRVEVSAQNGSITRILHKRSNTELIDDLKRTKRSEEHTSELQSRGHLVCRLLLEKKKKSIIKNRFN